MSSTQIAYSFCTCCPGTRSETGSGGAVGWLFNGTSTQKGQFVPTVGRETGSVG